MAKQEKKLKTGFVIKLSSETVQKLSEEEPIDKLTEKLPETSSEIVGPVEEKQVIDKHQDAKISNEIRIEKEATTQAVGISELKSDSLKTKLKKVVTHDSERGNNDSVKQKSQINESSDKWGVYASNITYLGEEAIYTDPVSKHSYTWSKDSNSWVDRNEGSAPERVCSYENDTHVFTESDGSKFFWDKDKKAWIPKVDDDFLAHYQMSYGFVDNRSEEKKVEPKEEEKKQEIQKKEAGVKRKTEPQWFQPSEETNTKVYVSNLPLDLTEEEFVNFMQKCGLVERDLSTQKMKVKLYMDKEQNCFKGDALCTYIKIESVELALKLIDGSDFKGHKVKVERASFQQKGEYNPALKPKKKKKKELEKLKKMQQKLFDWRPEKFIGERSKHERVVIVKNLFHPTDFDKEVQLILDYQQDLREECTKCGEVRKVVIYDRHPEGVAQITMKEPEMADAVIQLINGRWFGKRQITAEIWDGRTKYRIAETDADISKRINKWDKFLEGKDEGAEAKKPDDVQSPATLATEGTENENVSKNMECE